MAVEAGLDAKRIQELDRQHVLHSWSVQDQISPLPVAGAEGRYFWNYDGSRYLDFASQLVNVNLGHQHPKVVAAIKEQADKLTTIGPPMAHESRSELARLIAEVTPATGDPRRCPAEPGIPGVVRMLDPYTYRCPAGHPDPCPVCTGAPHLEEILQYEGPQNVAAVILETVTGTNGVIPPPEDYLQAIREVCDRHGILLICDEVMAGFGRTGRWFACENWDVVPDILCVAKGINSGYVPLGAMIVRKPIADWVRDKYFAGGLTYSGHPLACASAVASIEAFKEEGILENSAAMGDVFREELGRLAARHPSIGEVRGLGCFWALELVRNRETREPLVPFDATGEDFAPMARVAKAALERGLYLMVHWNVIMICPPLVITREEIEEGVAILDDALSLADEVTAG